MVLEIYRSMIRGNTTDGEHQNKRDNEFPCDGFKISSWGGVESHYCTKTMLVIKQHPQSQACQCGTQQL